MSQKLTKSPRPSLRALVPLLPYVRRYRGRIGAAFLALMVASAATLTVPEAVRRMIDFGFLPDKSGLINAYFGAMAAVVGVLAAASAARYFLVITLGERVVADLRSDLFGHLSRLDAAFFDTAQTGELVSRLTADTTQLKSTFGASASVALRNLFLFVGATAMMVVSSPKLSGLTLAAIPIIVLPLVLSGRGVSRRSRAAQDRLADAMAYAAENLGGIRTMQAYGAEPATRARFDEAIEHAYAAARGRDRRPLVADRNRHLSGVWQCGRRPVARSPRRHGRTAVGWVFVAIRALRGFRSGSARRTQPGLE